MEQIEPIEPVYNHSFVSIILSYDCKQVPVGLWRAEKIAEIVFLNVFIIGFTTSLLNQFIK